MRGAIVGAEGVCDVLNQDDLRHARWLVDYNSTDKITLYPLIDAPISVKTKYQHVTFLHTERFGHALMLDGAIQLAQADEFIYHELLVHPVLSVMAGSRQSVLVLGGGDGCVAREACRYGDVQQVTVVDLDPELVELCKVHLGDINRNAFDDPRVHLVADDALKVLRQSQGRFNAIISDLTDPDIESPAEQLYCAATFDLVRRRLEPGGLFVIQSCSFSHHHTDRHMHRIGRELREVFESAVVYGDYVPSFDGIWCFWVAGDRSAVERCCRHGQVDLPEGLRFYTPAVHRRAFTLSAAFGEGEAACETT